jgi:ACR3 family arsenite efflux pump ArsB
MLSEKTLWIIVKSIFALVFAFAFYYACQGGLQFAEILGAVVFFLGLAWMAGLGEKYYVVESKGTMYNTGIAAVLCLAGLLLIWVL